MSIQKSGELYTPLYKIFFFISLLTFSVFGFSFTLIQSRNTELKTAYEKLELEGKKSFSTLTAYHHVISGNGKRHIYTYLVTDEYGKIHEINEYVDNKSHLRLRVGNTVVTLQKKITLSGKEKIISRIEGNKQILPNYNYLETISFFGVGFSILIGIGGCILLLFKRDLA
ncbi:MAG: hypothetical protein IPL26_06010 [Leptospiraceae bacterium]|nr:hypothetical protein [Leptospiraceae bacterium]